MAKDIFDLSDVSDVPERLRPKRRRGENGIWADLLREAGRPITRQQWAIARYRRDGYVPAHDSGMSPVIDRLLRKGTAIRLRAGLYVHKDHYRPEMQQAAE